MIAAENPKEGALAFKAGFFSDFRNRELGSLQQRLRMGKTDMGQIRGKALPDLFGNT